MLFLAFGLCAVISFVFGYAVRSWLIQDVPGVLTGKAAKEFAEKFLTERAPDPETIERNKEAIKVYLENKPKD